MLQRSRNGRRRSGKRRPRPFDAAAAVLRVRAALYHDELASEDLTARTVARFLGLTTSVFYHHFGSFELFLYAVSISGLSVMADEMEIVARSRSPLLRIAEYYIELALTRPALFDLMLQRTFPWSEIRAKNLLDTQEGLRAWNILITAIRGTGSRTPLEDTRLFHATLHGIATLAPDECRRSRAHRSRGRASHGEATRPAVSRVRDRVSYFDVSTSAEAATGSPVMLFMSSTRSACC